MQAPDNNNSLPPPACFWRARNCWKLRLKEEEEAFYQTKFFGGKEKKRDVDVLIAPFFFWVGEREREALFT